MNSLEVGARELFASRRNESAFFFGQLDGEDQIRTQTWLENVALSSGFQGRAAGFAISVDGKKNNTSCRADRLKTPSGFYAVEDWHGDIQDGDVRGELGSSIYRCLPVAYCGDDFAAICGQEATNVFPHLVVVVSQQYADLRQAHIQANTARSKNIWLAGEPSGAGKTPSRPVGTSGALGHYIAENQGRCQTRFSSRYRV